MAESNTKIESLIRGILKFDGNRVDNSDILECPLNDTARDSQW